MYKDFSEGVVVLTMPSFYQKRLKAVILVAGMLFLTVLGAEHTTRSLPEETGDAGKEHSRISAGAGHLTETPLLEVSEIPMTLVSGKNPTEFADAAESTVKLAEILWKEHAKADGSETDRVSGLTGGENEFADGKSGNTVIPTVPTISDTPATPDIPTTPDTPDTPDLPTIPDTPATPDIPTIPDTPDSPDLPARPDEPGMSDGATEPKDAEDTGREENPKVPVINGFLLDEEGWIVGIDPATFATDDGYLELPSESCKGIRAHAFEGCTEAITEIYVPENIVGMEEGAFLGLPDLEWLEVEACNPNFSSLDGVIFDKKDSRLFAFPAARTGTYEPPASLTEIADYALDQNSLSGLEFRKYQSMNLGSAVFGTGNGAGIRIYINGAYLNHFEEIFDGYDVEVIPYYP